MISKKKKSVILINFWGLGDLIATFHLIRNNEDNKYHIITPHKQKLVEDLKASLNIVSKVSVSRHNYRYLLVLEILKYMVLGRYLVFAAPLDGKSRKLGIFLSYFYGKIFITKKYGNIYYLNDLVNF